MRFADVKVGLRLALGFGLVLLLMAALTAVAISRMSFMRGQMDQIVEGDSAKLHLINGMRDLVRYESVAIRDVVMQDDFAFKKSELKKMREAMQAYQEQSTQLEQLLTNAENKANLAKIGETGIKVKATLDEAIGESISENDKGAADVIRDKVRPAQMELTSQLADLLQHVETQSKNSAADAAAAYTKTVLLMIILGIMAILTGVTITYFLQRSIALPLGRALAAAESIAQGDLTQDIEATSSDEVGQLLKAMKRMSESLVGIVGNVRNSTESITLSSQEIAQGNADLSQRTEEQASSLEETASSIEELTTTVRQNTDNARQASQLATSASDIAVKGGEVVDDVVHTMASISESSKKIVDIISVIEGIAFQTNILALNAAVEAARAGEQGRGFAVVAGEVRNLAQRSAAAAKEIKALIDDSVGKVDIGSKQVDRAGATMTEIVTAVKRVTDIMSEIAAASIEQSAGIEQVNQAITQMDEVTQQNAALVEEAAAAAEAMQEQAQALAQAVSAFKLETGKVASRTAVKPEVQHAARPALTHQASTVQHVPAVVIPRKERKLAKVMGSGGEWKEF